MIGVGLESGFGGLGLKGLGLGFVPMQHSTGRFEPGYRHTKGGWDGVRVTTAAHLCCLIGQGIELDVVFNAQFISDCVVVD